MPSILTSFPVFARILVGLAHVIPGGSGAIEGFLHPLLGIDHLLAMLTVGLLSAQLGGRAIWSVPLTFVSVMALGGFLGYQGLEIPYVEFGIALSVLILGIALFAKRRIPELVAMAFVGIFAMFHGYAHGAEIPAVQDDNLFVLAYVIGFLNATAGLHVVGALIGYLALRSDRGALVLRLSGLVVAVMGILLISSL